MNTQWTISIVGVSIIKAKTKILLKLFSLIPHNVAESCVFWGGGGLDCVWSRVTFSLWVLFEQQDLSLVIYLRWNVCTVGTEVEAKCPPLIFLSTRTVKKMQLAPITSSVLHVRVPHIACSMYYPSSHHPLPSVYLRHNCESFCAGAGDAGEEESSPARGHRRQPLGNAKETLTFLLLFLAVPCGLWDLSSPTRDWTRAPCSGSAES